MMNDLSKLNDMDQCLRGYSHLVKRLAHQMMLRLPRSVQIDDIIQNGMMGLLCAASRYDEIRGVQFETYATRHIRGAMLDELREADWLPRSLRRDMRHIEASISHLQQRLGRSPTETEIAGKMKLSLAGYQKMLQESCGTQLVYSEDFCAEEHNGIFARPRSGHSDDPLDLLEGQRFKARLARAIDCLPERERMVMGMIYEQEMNLRDISKVLGVGVSRISQLRSQAIVRLRGWMRNC